MAFKMLRRGSPRCIGVMSILVVIIICLYYISIGQNESSAKEFTRRRFADVAQLIKLNYSDNEISREHQHIENEPTKGNLWKRCVELKEALVDITTTDEYSRFDFQPNWLRSKEYWDNSFEQRYEELMKNTSKPNLKVIVVPFSHNDPGWLKTFLNYFQSDTRQILNYVITKMQEYTDLTFIWAEISYLQLWWDQAHPTKQRALKHLVHSGRFEITTGGWVMTDEANVHVYPMIDQLIEGHQWLKDNLNYTPTTGFSIDPFGHGSTLPYLLAASGFDGTIIQRIHYAWKQYFAKRQYGDFLWTPFWDDGQKANDRTMLTHNMPFDIYSIKHSCGPHPYICLNFDFRKVPGEYTEYSFKAQFITNENVETKADLLIEQYSRTASLFPHNVALIPLGDDFRYNKENEVDQQYNNYKKLMDYINANPGRYNKTQISFGLPRDYFAEIKRRHHQYPHLKGDFFVYSDIFTEGRPAYWSGYFTTRPMYKMLSRELEHNLRSAEILFTVALNQAKQSKNANALRIFEKNYEKMTIARRNMGLFQHHDAITGTSKAAVMRDYGFRLFESIKDAVRLQEDTIELLLQNSSTVNEYNYILSELERGSFTKIPKKTPITLQANQTTEFVLFNSLTQERLEMVALRSKTPHVKIFDNHGTEMKIQINPVWNLTDAIDSAGKTVHSLRTSSQQYEVLFVANIPALALVTYTARYVVDDTIKGKKKKRPLGMATVYCNECKSRGNGESDSLFDIKVRQQGDIQLENSVMRLLFDGATGFLRTITPKDRRKTVQCGIKFAAYRSAQFHSGAYLFKPDREERDMEKDVLEQYDGNQIVFITSGPVASDVTVVYGNFLAHTVRVFNTGTSIDNAIYIENDIDFESPPKNRETELFMRFVTSIDNTVRSVFYTDQNSFQYLRREKIQSVGIEANYYPITSAAFIQDEQFRLTLLTTHAQGAASSEPGYLEVMLDRRTLHDDYRGMGEGVVDSVLTRQKYWLVLEEFHDGNVQYNEPRADRDYEMPSHYVNQLSNIHNYPVNIYFVERTEEMAAVKLNSIVPLFKMQFPCDVHLTTLRTQTEAHSPLFPSQSALMVLHRQATTCKLKDIGIMCRESHGFVDDSLQLFYNVHVETAQSVSLTGLKSHGKIRSFKSVYIRPMDIVSFNLTFA